MIVSLGDLSSSGRTMLILFSFIWSVSPIWTLFIILWKSDDIFDPEKARTSWSTFDGYLGDPLRWGWVPILLVLLIVHLLRRWKDQKGSLAS